LAIQICYKLDRDNLDGELGGLIEALAFSGQKKGFVITLNQSDTFTSNDLTAQIMQEWKFIWERADRKKFL
jgi:hypothetical protein